MHREVSNWLKAQDMQVCEKYLRLRLESHPDYPSLTAVADSLGEIDIQCDAYQTNREELVKKGNPFIAHFSTGQGHIQYFPNMATAEKNVKDFHRHWSGVVLLAEKCGNYGNAEHNKQLKQEKQNNVFLIGTISLILLLLTALSFYRNASDVFLLLLFNSIGLCFSWLIVQKELGISNSVSDKICSMAKHSRCEAVLLSKGARLFSWLTWGDTGIIYFTSTLVFLAIALLLNQQTALQFYYLVSLAGLFFPVYSLYYQWKVVKQWCMLCIGVLAVLFLNAVAGFIFFRSGDLFTASLLYSSLVFVFVTGILLFSWHLFKSIYQNGLAALSNEIKALKQMRNPEIFNALLEKENVNPINLPSPDEAIRFGNASAPYQLLIACNPYCGPCAKAHHAIEGLYEKFQQQLAVSVRFAIQENNSADKRIAAVKEILKAAQKKPLESVKDWYSLSNLEKFKQLHPTNGEQVDAAIEQHIIWSREVGITATPTIFINGRRLPALYDWMSFTAILEFICREAELK